jgi:hypothetical protein
MCDSAIIDTNSIANINKRRIICVTRREAGMRRRRTHTRLHKSACNWLPLAGDVHRPSFVLNKRIPSSRPSLSNAAPVIDLPGPRIYSAGFNVNQKFKKKIFLNNSMFQLFFVALP